jgi:hypothetical protein
MEWDIFQSWAVKSSLINNFLYSTFAFIDILIFRLLVLFWDLSLDGNQLNYR